MKKTIIALVILLIGVIGFYACGTDKTSPTTEEPTLMQSSVDSATAAQPVTAVETKPDTTAAATKEANQNIPVEKQLPKKASLVVGTEKKADALSINNEEKDNTADIDEGKVLISAADCFACHKVQEKLVGPSYTDVAKKYTASEQVIEQLATKVKEGGAGAWGQVPMSPHPSLSKSDAKKMVRYILSLK